MLNCSKKYVPLISTNMKECSNTKWKSKFVEGNMQIGITNVFTKSVCRTLLLKIEECSKSFDHNLNHAATKIHIVSSRSWRRLCWRCPTHSGLFNNQKTHSISQERRRTYIASKEGKKVSSKQIHKIKHHIESHLIIRIDSFSNCSNNVFLLTFEFQR